MTATTLDMPHATPRAAGAPGPHGPEVHEPETHEPGPARAVPRYTSAAAAHAADSLRGVQRPALAAFPAVQHWARTEVPRLADIVARLAREDLVVARCLAPAGVMEPWRPARQPLSIWVCSGWLDLEWQAEPPVAGREGQGMHLRLGPGDRLDLPAGTRFRLRVEGDVPAWYAVGEERLSAGPRTDPAMPSESREP